MTAETWRECHREAAFAALENSSGGSGEPPPSACSALLVADPSLGPGNEEVSSTQTHHHTAAALWGRGPERAESVILPIVAPDESPTTAFHLSRESEFASEGLLPKGSRRKGKKQRYRDPCFICGGTHTRLVFRSTTNEQATCCHTCYTGLWRDAMRVSREAANSNPTPDAFDTMKKVLTYFWQEMLRTDACPAARPAADRSPSKPSRRSRSRNPVVATVQMQSQQRCARCRTRDAIDHIPVLAYRLFLRGLKGEVGRGHFICSEQEPRELEAGGEPLMEEADAEAVSMPTVRHKRSAAVAAREALESEFSGVGCPSDDDYAPTPTPTLTATPAHRSKPASTKEDQGVRQRARIMSREDSGGASAMGGEGSWTLSDRDDGEGDEHKAKRPAVASLRDRDALQESGCFMLLAPRRDCGEVSSEQANHNTLLNEPTPPSSISLTAEREAPVFSGQQSWTPALPSTNNALLPSSISATKQPACLPQGTALVAGDQLVVSTLPRPTPALQATVSTSKAIENRDNASMSVPSAQTRPLSSTPPPALIPLLSESAPLVTQVTTALAHTPTLAAAAPLTQHATAIRVANSVPPMPVPLTPARPYTQSHLPLQYSDVSRVDPMAGLQNPYAALPHPTLPHSTLLHPGLLQTSYPTMMLAAPLSNTHTVPTFPSALAQPAAWSFCPGPVAAPASMLIGPGGNIIHTLPTPAGLSMPSPYSFTAVGAGAGVQLGSSVGAGAGGLTYVGGISPSLLQAQARLAPPPLLHAPHGSFTFSPATLPHPAQASSYLPYAAMAGNAAASSWVLMPTSSSS
eukprot:m.71686 g.71686  ORF g.71686 m.71686 type:complete len:804 (-) comp12958_c1_seq2:20-2431(-)